MVKTQVQNGSLFTEGDRRYIDLIVYWRCGKSLACIFTYSDHYMWGKDQIGDIFIYRPSTTYIAGKLVEIIVIIGPKFLKHNLRET